MPNLLFYPQYERHLRFEALAQCPRLYRNLLDIAEGRREDRPSSTSLLIGIGADYILSKLYEVGYGHADDATAYGLQRLHEEAKGEAAYQKDSKLIQEELALLAPQYAEQWGDVRWPNVLTLHPYEQEANHPRLLLDIGPTRYLTMPDMECEYHNIITIWDFKTGRYAYDAELWVMNLQCLANCLAAERHYNRPVQYLIDYCQRPTKQSKRWVFPATFPVPFDDAAETYIVEWLQRQEVKREAFIRCAQWPRERAACRTWHGLCEWLTDCWGGER